MWLYGWLLLLAGVSCSEHFPRRQYHNGRHVQRVHPNFNLKYAKMHWIRAKIIPLEHVDKPQHFIGRIRREILDVHDDIASFLDKSKRHVKGDTIVKRQVNNSEIENKLLEAKLRTIANKLIKIIIKFAEDEPRNDIIPKIFANVTNKVVNDSSNSLNLTNEVNVRSNVASVSLSNISVVNFVASNNSNAVDNNITIGKSFQANSILANVNQTVQNVPRQANDNTTEGSLKINNAGVGNQQSPNIAHQQPLGYNGNVVQIQVTKEPINFANNVVDSNNVVVQRQLPDPYPVLSSKIKKRSHNSEDHKKRRNAGNKNAEILAGEFPSYVPMKHISKRNLDAIDTNIEQYNSKKKRQIPLLESLPDVIKNVNNLINGTINGVFKKGNFTNNLTLFRHTSINNSIPENFHSVDRSLPYTVADGAHKVQQLSKGGNELVPAHDKNNAAANIKR